MSVRRRLWGFGGDWPVGGVREPVRPWRQSVNRVTRDTAACVGTPVLAGEQLEIGVINPSVFVAMPGSQEIQSMLAGKQFHELSSPSGSLQYRGFEPAANVSMIRI
jgi:hypothetical protein